MRGGYLGLTAVVLGDIMLDVRAILDDEFTSAIANDAVSESEVTVSLAGTGVGMARALALHLDGAASDGAAAWSDSFDAKFTGVFGCVRKIR